MTNALIKFGITICLQSENKNENFRNERNKYVHVVHKSISSIPYILFKICIFILQ